MAPRRCKIGYTERMERFWETVPLAEMTAEQWEALCDGCGKCCLEKLEEEGSGRIHYTNVACELLDRSTGRCQHYGARFHLMPSCLPLNPKTIQNPHWLPRTCAYRRLQEGKPLPAWHPLLSGDPNSVRRAGHSVADRVIAPRSAGLLIHHLIDWID